MKFDDLDQMMRVFETAHDRCVPVGSTIVARIDGRGFTKLTKEKCDFERPFWQKRGIGMYWANEERKGFDPKQQIEVVTRRNTLRVELDLPKNESYSEFLTQLLSPPEK